MRSERVWWINYMHSRCLTYARMWPSQSFETESIFWRETCDSSVVWRCMKMGPDEMSLKLERSDREPKTKGTRCAIYPLSS